MFFAAGGLLYLYREKLQKLADEKLALLAAVLAGVTVLYYLVHSSDYLLLLVFSLTCTCCLRAKSGGVLQSKPILWFSGISMEIYLCHMFAFRILQKLNLFYRFGTGWLAYWITAVSTIIGAVLISVILKRVITFIEKKVEH